MRRDATYAGLLADTLTGLDSWHPREKKAAFSDLKPGELKPGDEYHRRRRFSGARDSVSWSDWHLPYAWAFNTLMSVSVEIGIFP